MATEKICVFAPRSRNSADTCGLKLSKLNEQEARACGFSNEIFVCFKHLQEKKRLDSQKCCYPFKEANCSNSLVNCPKRLFKTFDKTGTDVGTQICTFHLKEADESSDITEKENYVGPSPRKVSLIIFLLKNEPWLQYFILI